MNTHKIVNGNSLAVQKICFFFINFFWLLTDIGSFGQKKNILSIPCCHRYKGLNVIGHNAPEEGNIAQEDLFALDTNIVRLSHHCVLYSP